MALSADVAHLEAAAPAYARAMNQFRQRNFALLVLDGATFSFAIALLSEATFIPAFIQALTSSAMLVGLVAAVFAVGRYAPQLIGAHLILGRPRRKPLFLGIVVAERVGILAIALSAQLVGSAPKPLVVVLFFLAFGGYAVTTGLIGPVYGDFVAKAITRSRGWFYGVTQLLGGSLGFAAAIVGRRMLEAYGFPVGYQMAFWICFGLSLLSIAFVASLKETEYPLAQQRPPFSKTVRQLTHVVLDDGAYRRFLTARALLAFATLGVGFVVVDGLRRGVLSQPDAAIAAAAFILAQAILGFILGLVGNYLGWRIVVVLGGVLIIGAMALAASQPGRWSYFVMMGALGGANAVTVVGDANMSIELAPPTLTSLYLGTTATLLAPFFILGPLLAGAISPASGIQPIFVAGGVLAVLGTAVAFTIPEPRRHVEAPPSGQPGLMP